MNLYLIQISYTPDAWAAMLKEPQNRIERVSGAVKNLGGNIVSGYIGLGDYDIIAIFEFPDNQTATAATMAFMAGGAIRDIKVTPLITMEEGVKAMAKGAGIGYKPVTSK